MGTVPDPQGSERTLLVTTSVEENCAEPHTPHSDIAQYKQATTNKNGSVITISDSKPIGICSYDLNCSQSMKNLDSEKISEDEKQEPNKSTATSQTSSQSEMLPSLNMEALTNKESLVIDKTVHMCPTSDTQLLSETIAVSTDVANLSLSSKIPSTEDNSLHKENIVVEKTESGPMHLKDEICVIPEDINIKADQNKEENVSLLSQKTETLNKIENIANVSNFASSNTVQECGETNHSINVIFPQPDECSQISLAEEKINNAEEQETGEYTLCRFKEKGTMTSHPENLDAAVQAVVNVENKSVSTSPSILSAFLKLNSPMRRQRQDQVCFIYQGNPGNPQMDRANFALQAQLSQNHLAPKVCFQPPDALGSQALQLHTKSPPDMVRPGFQHPDKGRNPQLLYRNEIDGQSLCVREGHPVPQMQMGNASPILMNVKPVYQINAENSNQPKPCQPLKDMYGDPSQFRPAHEISNKPRLHHLSGIENIQLHNVPPDPENMETLSIPGDISGDRKPFHFKITNEQGSTQTIITTDIKKPKKEDRPTPLHVEVEVNSSMGATGGQVDEILEVLVKKEQDDSENAKRSSSLSLQSRPASDFTQHAGQLTPRLRKAREEKKEPVVITLPTSEQLPLGKKGAQASSSTESKSQVKQSKSVKDVVWDEQGMTWEVYGASMDPESLGIAIQNHLQRQIREHEKMIRAQLKQNRKSICSDSSGKKHKRRQHRVFQALLKNFRRPNCCVRPPSTAVLD
ncbi:G protein-regulated inducer of neurite outgrowth 3 [Bombina bombina]|uniref:G protein-regulated inducer of neurite outgrowth 3 n=1 Tax=Bombina bombina TaxID=8345 RepID=UPI00235A87E6|nr:G protein-regulated inducer of neurite outgrowth 3 [Bombina bombina]